MKSILVTIAICWTLLAGLWWHFKSTPAHLAVRHPVIAPCPANSTLRGDTCTCNLGTRLQGTACRQVWTSTSSRVTREYLGMAPLADNCVFFARKRVPSLPYGLSTWNGKLKAINSHTPQPGSVAMIQIMSGVYKHVGHVAVIEAVTRDSLTIIEGNYISGIVTRRTASAKNVEEAAHLLNITGYYRP